jgi:hypothetical protein
MIYEGSNRGVEDFGLSRVRCFFFMTGLNCIGREIDRKGYDQFLNWKNLRKIGEERERERELNLRSF